MNRDVGVHEAATQHVALQDVADLMRRGRLLDLCGGWNPSRLGLRDPALDHVGFAVRNLEASRLLCAGLGLQVTAVETIPAEGVRVGILPVGSAKVELLEALAEETPVGRFLSRCGEGIHHVALRVQAIDALFTRCSEQGLRLASRKVGVGAGGHRYFFLHPESTGGTLVELVEDREEASS